jgi:tetratricopeptide (TPR) repeat protein
VGSVFSLVWLGDALLQLGRVEEAVSAAREAVVLLGERAYWAYGGWAHGVLCEALARLCATDAWLALAEAESMIARLEQFFATPCLLRARGLLLAHQNDLGKAIAALMESAAVAREQESLVQAGRTLAALAVVARSAGDLTLATDAAAERLAVVEQIGPEARGLPWAHESGTDQRD